MRKRKASGEAGDESNAKPLAAKKTRGADIAPSGEGKEESKSTEPRTRAKPIVFPESRHARPPKHGPSQVCLDVH